MAINWTQLEAEVTRNKSVDDGITAVVNRIAAELLAHAGEQDKVIALANELKSHNDTLADAIIANTPAAEPPVVP